MSAFIEGEDYSVISAVVPRKDSTDIVDAVLTVPGQSALSLNARGTLVKDRWYQSLMPALNPEQEIIQFLAPNDQVEGLMGRIVRVGRLQYSGAGAIFATPCRRVCFSESYPLWPAASEAEETLEPIANLKSDLVNIFCIVQSHISDVVARAAVNAGAHGPTIHYCEGRGLRDRLGLLRITQNAEKEVIQVVVNAYDADLVFDAMATAARISEPGVGILFRMPVSKGLINIESIMGSARHTANLRQIISAIDDLKGGAEWRVHGMMAESESTGLAKSLIRFGRTKEKKALLDFEMLTCLIKRKNSDAILDAAFAAGAPAASTAYGKFIEADCGHTAAGLRLNRELGVIKMILPPSGIDGVVEAMKAAAIEQEFNELCFYSQAVPKALTYLGG